MLRGVKATVKVSYTASLPGTTSGVYRSSISAGSHGNCMARSENLTTIQREVDGGAPYCSSLTFSIQSTTLPFRFSVIARWVIAVFGDAPCQCL